MAPVYCPDCGYDNEDARASCVMCYAALTDAESGEVCTQCSTDNPPGSKFCRGCGNQLDPMGTKVPSRRELGEMALESLSGGGLMGHGGAAEDEEEDFAPLAGSDDFEVADVGPAPAAPAAAAAAAAAPAPPPAAAPVPPPPTGTEEEGELPPPRVSAKDAVDMSKLGPPPPPPPPSGAAPPPPPPPPPAAGAPPPPPPPPPGPGASAPDTFEIEEPGEGDDDFSGWELDDGEKSPDIGP